MTRKQAVQQVWWWYTMVYGRNSNVDTECSICGLTTNNVVRCLKNHAICRGDFNRHIKTQIANFRKAFIDNGCKLSCPSCTPSSHFHRRCAAALDDETYSLYENCKTEEAVIQTTLECERRFNSVPGPASQTQTPDELALSKLMLILL